MKTRGRRERWEVWRQGEGKYKNRGDGVGGKKGERKDTDGTEGRKQATRISCEVSCSKNCQEGGW